MQTDSDDGIALFACASRVRFVFLWFANMLINWPISSDNRSIKIFIMIFRTDCSIYRFDTFHFTFALVSLSLIFGSYLTVSYVLFSFISMLEISQAVFLVFGMTGFFPFASDAYLLYCHR